MADELTGITGRFKAAFAWGTAKASGANPFFGFFNMFKAGSPLYYPRSRFTEVIRPEAGFLDAVQQVFGAGASVIAGRTFAHLEYQVSLAKIKVKREMAALAEEARQSFKAMKAEAKKAGKQVGSEYEDFKREMNKLIKDIDGADSISKIGRIKAQQEALMEQIYGQEQAVRDVQRQERRADKNIEHLAKKMNFIIQNGIKQEKKDKHERPQYKEFKGNFSDLVKIALKQFNGSKNSKTDREARSISELETLIRNYLTNNPNDRFLSTAAHFAIHGDLKAARAPKGQLERRTGLGKSATHGHNPPSVDAYQRGGTPRFDTGERQPLLTQQHTHERTRLQKFFGLNKKPKPSTTPRRSTPKHKGSRNG